MRRDAAAERIAHVHGLRRVLQCNLGRHPHSDARKQISHQSTQPPSSSIYSAQQLRIERLLLQLLFGAICVYSSQRARAVVGRDRSHLVSRGPRDRVPVAGAEDAVPLQPVRRILVTRPQDLQRLPDDHPAAWDATRHKGGECTTAAQRSFRATAAAGRLRHTCQPSGTARASLQIAPQQCFLCWVRQLPLWPRGAAAVIA